MAKLDIVPVTIRGIQSRDLIACLIYASFTLLQLKQGVLNWFESWTKSQI
ncbi:MAG: hypothetical protein HFG42_17700 [Lachnospiraceae bacterium]|nr:hypothetical protein [Lachnospiraceae bacterium]